MTGIALSVLSVITGLWHQQTVGWEEDKTLLAICVRLCVHTLRILYGTYLETDIREEEVSVFHPRYLFHNFAHRKG